MICIMHLTTSSPMRPWLASLWPSLISLQFYLLVQQASGWPCLLKSRTYCALRISDRDYREGESTLKLYFGIYVWFPFATVKMIYFKVLVYAHDLFLRFLRRAAYLCCVPHILHMPAVKSENTVLLNCMCDLVSVHEE